MSLYFKAHSVRLPSVNSNGVTKCPAKITPKPANASKSAYFIAKACYALPIFARQENISTTNLFSRYRFFCVCLAVLRRSCSQSNSHYFVISILLRIRWPACRSSVSYIGSWVIFIVGKLSHQPQTLLK